jgi:hypothetical protein
VKAAGIRALPMRSGETVVLMTAHWAHLPPATEHF